MFNKIRQIMFPFTVREAFLEFETYLLAQSKPDDDEKINLRNYRSHLSSFVHLHGSKPFNKLTAHDVDVWIGEMVKRGLKGATINGRIAAIQTFERFCRRRYPKLQKKMTPFSLHLKKREDTARADETIPDDSEMERAIAVAYEMLESGDFVARRDATIFFWVVETGSRRKETAKLRISRLGLEKSALVRDEGGRFHAVYEAKVEGKSGIRPVDYTEEMARIMREWLKIRPGDSDFVFVGLGNCGRHQGKPPTTCVICRTYGQPATVWMIRWAFEAVAKKAGVDHHKLGAHGARHWLTQRIVETTEDVEVAQLRLGHRQLTTTLRYTHKKQTRRKQGAVATSILSQGVERGTLFTNSVAPPSDSVVPPVTDGS